MTDTAKKKRKKKKKQGAISVWIEQTRDAVERARVAATGRIRRYGNLFDLKHPRMTDEIRQALEKGRYEWREIGMIERHVRPDDRVLELGVCIGATSLVLYDTVGPDRLVVYEADPRNLEMAQNNFRLNRKPVHCVNAVLWSGPDRPETVTFSSNENPSSSSLIERPGTEQSVTVATEDLADALAAHRATVLVLDIEGGEVELFASSGPMPGVRLIMLEAHARVVGEEANEAMLRGLEGYGFEIVEDIGRKYLVLERRSAEPAFA